MTQKLKFGMERIVKIVGKGENAGDQHFLLFPQCFQKALFRAVFESGLCGKGLTLYHTTTTFNDSEKIFENIEGKEENFAEKGKYFSPTSLSNFFFLIRLVHPFPIKPVFLRTCSTSLYKTLRKQKKLLSMSNFSFSHKAFYFFCKLTTIFLFKFETVISKLLSV